MSSSDFGTVGNGSGPAIPQLEEDLCYLFSMRAPTIQEHLPQIITDAECTGRNAVRWGKRKALSAAMRRYAIDPQNPNATTKQQQDKRFSSLSTKAFRWRVANGIFVSDEWTGKEAEKAAMKVAVDFTDDNWFFGVTGFIYLEHWNMSPSLDLSLSQQQVQSVSADIPFYSLPNPQDVKASMRAELVRRGRTLPTYREWLIRNPLIFARCHFDDFLQYHHESIFTNLFNLLAPHGADATFRKDGKKMVVKIMDDNDDNEDMEDAEGGEHGGNGGDGEYEEEGEYDEDGEYGEDGEAGSD